MDGEIFLSMRDSVQTYSKNASAFLSGNKQVSEELQQISGKLYQSGKLVKTQSLSDPLSQLHVIGFDDEQIWQQIELFNKSETKEILQNFNFIKSINETNFFNHSKNVDNNVEINSIASDNSAENEELSDDNQMLESENEEEAFAHSSDDDSHANENFRTETYEKTNVDDDFFSVRQMEKFLIEEEHKEEVLGNKIQEDPNDINYFEDIVSSDDDEDVDLFSNQERNDESLSSRNLKYNSFFDPPLNTVAEKPFENEVKLPTIYRSVDDVQQKLLKIANLSSDKQSKFTKTQDNLQNKIKTLEAQVVLPPTWQMKGETTAQERETNALLEEDLSFDVVSRPAPEITDEYTMTLEDIIKQRIIDLAWDDVERKSKPKEIPEYKKRITLDSSQSKLSLGEIYAEDYKKQVDEGKTYDDSEKENPLHTEIKADMKNLFEKLSALSNYRFNAAIPEPEVKIIPLMPSIAIEEVQPVARSLAQTLAPEEIFDKRRNDNMKTDKEKSTTDKKRERRKKKLRRKMLSKSELSKQLSKDSSSDKAQTLLAMKKLKNAAKSASGRTTIIQNNPKSQRSEINLTSSKDFFTELQDRTK